MAAIISLESEIGTCSTNTSPPSWTSTFSLFC